MPSLLADFQANTVLETRESNEPEMRRVLLNQHELVLVGNGNDRESIQLSTVVDVVVDSTPMFVDPLQGTPITIAFRDGLKHATVVIASDEQTSEQFRQDLFESLLNGTDVTVYHPANVGGRVTDSHYTSGNLRLNDGSVSLDTDEGSIAIDLDSVFNFSLEDRTIEGDTRSAIVVEQMNDGESLATIVAPDSNRSLSLFGRYLQVSHRRTLESLQNLTLTDPEITALQTILSANWNGVSLSSVLDIDQKTVKKLLSALCAKDLVESRDGRPVLTARGQIVLDKYLERTAA